MDSSLAKPPASAFDEPMERCPFCRSPDLRELATDFAGRRIDHCESCGVELLNPQYTDEHLASLYQGYGGISEESWTGHDADTNRRREAFHHAYLDLVEEHVAPGRFLGLGCGDALELRVALERGWSVSAFDVDSTAVRNVERRLGIPAYSGDFVQTSLDGPYECIYLHHVLEHPKNPQDYLGRIRELLSPGGVVLIACPNLDSLSSRYKTFVSRLRLKKRPFKHYDAWQHLFFFTPRTLASLMEDLYGYEVLTTRAGMDWRTHPLSLPPRLLRRLDRWTILKSKFVLLARARTDSERSEDPAIG